MRVDLRSAGVIAAVYSLSRRKGWAASCAENRTSPGPGVIADLGLPSAPGNNTIKDNSITGVKFDLFFADDLSHVSAFASGNTWNPSIQGSDGSGHYAVNQTMSGPNSGKNFQLDEFDFRLDF